MPDLLDEFRPNVLADHVALIADGGTGIRRSIALAYAKCGADVRTLVVDGGQGIFSRSAAGNLMRTSDARERTL